MTSFPRLLFVTGEPPHTQAAGAIYFYRLLQDYPADRLHIVTNQPPPASAGRLSCHYATLRLWADRLNRTRLWPWRARLRALGASRAVRLSRVDAAVGDFRPDAVATLMQDSWYYDLAARYAAARRLPLILFVHDVAHGFEPVPVWLQNRQRARDTAVYRQARVRFCVSPGMATWFRDHFGVPGEALLPPASSNLPRQDAAACRQLKTPGRLTLGYAGGLHYGYGEQLVALIPAFRAAGARVELFGPKPHAGLQALSDAADVFVCHGYALTPEAAWSSLVERCDALLLPYLNPPGAHALQYRTHFPSKLGDSLQLGLPLIVTGPPDAAGMYWFNQYPGSALTVESASTEAFAAALVRLREDAELRVSLAAAAPLAAAPMARETVRDRFLTALSAA